MTPPPLLIPYHAAPLTDCTCRGLTCVATNCTTTIYSAFRGTDKSAKPLYTAYQVESINKYSISNLFASFTNTVRGA